MKRNIMIVLTVVTLGLAGYQLANAGPGWHGGAMMGQGPGYCDNCGYGLQSGKNLSEDEIKVREKFFEETVDLRKQITVKKAELRALMTQENVDTKKAGTLAGELFELRNDFHKKAKESGVKLGPREFGDHTGALGKGSGRHHGRHGRGMGWGVMQGPRWNRYCQ